jgi:hypothetical protein
MASLGRSLPSHSSWSAVASRRSPSPDQLPQSDVDISSSVDKISAENNEAAGQYENRALTIKTTSAEAFGTSAPPEGEYHDPEDVVASPLQLDGPMQDIPHEPQSELSSNGTNFSAILQGIPVDLRYSMDRFFARETHGPEEECEELQILDDNAQKTGSDLRAARRYMNETEEDEALRLIGSIHAQ